MNAELVIPSADFLDACSRLSGIARRAHLAKTDLVLDLEPSTLKLTLAGVSVSLPAQCQVRGRAIMPGHALDALAKEARRLRVAEVPVEIDELRLTLGTLQLHCRWVAAESRPLPLPLNATLADLLVLRQRHTDSELQSAGLLKLVSEADAKKEDLISKAAATLRPLGITRKDLDELLEAHLTEHARTYT